MISAGVAFSGIVEKDTSRTVSNSVDDINGKVRASFEAGTVLIRIPLHIRVHKLPCSDVADQFPKW